MKDFSELVQLRRSHRKFTGAEVSADDVKMILRAALMSPTSKGQRSWEFVVVDDKTDMGKMEDATSTGIVVLGNPVLNDCWIEDCSIASAAIQYQAEDLGLGSCWAQMRGRGLSDGTDAATVIRGILDIPENLEPLCVIGIGHKADERKPQSEDKLKWENVHVVNN